ncbi:MAG: DHH family phosphoesterase [Eggerthellaceae bacterium]|jgi:phosphoesterase RecJ-like protein
MTCSPQSNASLEEIAAKFNDFDSFVICGHVSPDGDCIGSQLSLGEALRRQGKTVTNVLVQAETLDATLRFLPGASDIIPAEEIVGRDFSETCFIAVDVPNRGRMGPAASKIFDRCAFRITIDHHPTDQIMSELNYIDPDAASVTLIIWELALVMGVDRSGDIALCAYTGLVTDTGSFQYQNTTPEAFIKASEMLKAGADNVLVSRNALQNRSLASLGLEARAISRMTFYAYGAVVLTWITLEDMRELNATKADAEPLINTIRAARGVRVACILREQRMGVRGSLRSKDDTDISEIARKFGGGGHKAAAGFTLNTNLRDARLLVSEELEKLMAEKK